MTDVSQFWKTCWCQKSKKESKENYISLSLLPVLSKYLETIMIAQTSAFFDNVFPKFQCAFRKGYNTQHCNLKMFEKGQNCLAKGKFFSALLTDLSKAFHCLDHNYSQPSWVLTDLIFQHLV